MQGEDLDACLEMMDYREYAMVDRKTLLEILIQRGTVSAGYERGGSIWI